MVCTQHTGAHGAALARCTSWCSAAHISCDSHAQTPYLGSIPEQDRAVLTAKTACPNLDALANAGVQGTSPKTPHCCIAQNRRCMLPANLPALHGCAMPAGVLAVSTYCCANLVSDLQP